MGSLHTEVHALVETLTFACGLAIEDEEGVRPGLSASHSCKRREISHV